jgi:hypothetical protein
MAADGPFPRFSGPAQKGPEGDDSKLASSTDVDGRKHRRKMVGRLQDRLTMGL